MESANNLLIVVDAGHGGYDNGASYNGRLEKDDNLRLALEVQKQMEAQGLSVLMTRADDTFVSLQDRAKMANNADADMFVSLHRNSYIEQTPTSNGVENIIYLTAPESSTGVAAALVLDEVVNVGVQNNRGVRRGNYYVLRKTNMPAMLLEMGYIINDIDNQLFDENLVNYAIAITKGVMRYFEIPFRPELAVYPQPVVTLPAPLPEPPIMTLPAPLPEPPIMTLPAPLPKPPIMTLPAPLPKPPIMTLPAPWPNSPIMTLPAPWPNAPITTLPGQIPGTPITTLPGQVPPESTFPIPTETACGIPGQRVTAAQKALNERYGFNLPVNGFYDCTTRTGVVMALQRVLNEQFGTALRADGNLTPETIAAIPSFPPNSPENLVYLLQIMLMLNAYDVGKIDGIYGPATRSAVQVFQKDYFIQPNGIAEPDMILKLLEC